jgi:hypothetical protein
MATRQGIRARAAPWWKRRSIGHDQKHANGHHHLRGLPGGDEEAAGWVHRYDPLRFALSHLLSESLIYYRILYGNMKIESDEVIRLYTKERFTLRMVAEKFNTDHHTIKRILVKNNVAITRRNSLKEFTQEHKDKISLACTGREGWSKGKTMPREFNLKNMRAHLKYDVSLEWLNSFEDIEKLKFLNRSLSRKRDCDGFTTDIYKQFIEKFYSDERFNKLYNEWVRTKDKWIKPSLDHIDAKCNGGSLLLDNLQFISWLENRAKVNIPQSEWEKMKTNIGYYL